MKKCALLIAFTLVGCTGPLDPKSVQDMPTAYLCDILGPNYTALPGERRTIYAELEKRGAQCVDHSIGVKSL